MTLEWLMSFLKDGCMYKNCDRQGERGAEAVLVRKNRNAMMPNGVVEELINQWDIKQNEIVRQ